MKKEDAQDKFYISMNALRLQNAHYLNFKNAATCSHLQPLDWPLVAASGCKWSQVAAGHKGISRASTWQPLAASGRRGLLEQVAASDPKWLQDPDFTI